MTRKIGAFYAACAALGLAVGVLYSVLTAAPAEAASSRYVFWGTDVGWTDCSHWWPRPGSGVPSYMASWPDCWHDDEGGFYSPGPHSAADFHRNLGPGDANVLVQLWYGGPQMTVAFLDRNWNRFSPTSCTGVGVRITNGGTYEGELRYIHIDVYGGVIGTSWQTYTGSNWERDLGVTSGSQPGCPWDGPHLHQSADTSASSAIYSNWTAQPNSSWIHRVYY